MSFVREPPEWFVGLEDEPVLFALNWSDREDYVMHKTHPECPTDVPHLLSECGRFAPRPVEHSS